MFNNRIENKKREKKKNYFRALNRNYLHPICCIIYLFDPNNISIL